MLELENYEIVAHVHDEIILEAPMRITVEEVEEKMQKTPAWAPGLVLKAEGYECRNFYRKE